MNICTIYSASIPDALFDETSPFYVFCKNVTFYFYFVLFYICVFELVYSVWDECVKKQRPSAKTFCRRLWVNLGFSFVPWTLGAGGAMDRLLWKGWMRIEWLCSDCLARVTLFRMAMRVGSELQGMHGDGCLKIQGGNSKD